MSQPKCEACGDPVSLCPSCAEYAQAAKDRVTGIQGAEHAFAVGQLIGELSKGNVVDPRGGLRLEVMLDDAGDYENHFIMHTASHAWRVEITPED